MHPESEGTNNDIGAIELANANYQGQQAKMQTQSAACTESDGSVGMEDSHDVLVAGGYSAEMAQVWQSDSKSLVCPTSKTLLCGFKDHVAGHIVCEHDPILEYME